MVKYLLNGFGSSHVSSWFPIISSQVYQVLQHELDPRADAFLRVDDTFDVLEVVIERSQTLQNDNKKVGL